MVTMIINSLVAALALATAPADSLPPDVDYRIEAILDEEAEVLRARAELRYTNHATTALDTLWLHQHLNAFRPNSAWAQRELEFGNRRFQDLGPEAHAFERLSTVTVDGTEVNPVYPGSPDSTVVALPLPSPLSPGSTAVVRMDWTARPSTLPRRQGRRGRHYDFAQWYPRVAAHTAEGWQVQPLLPQGEFFGEFGSYDVTLDLAADQVVGATGVPVEGDPGWADAAAPGQAAPRLGADAYAPLQARSLGLLADAPEQGRKRIRWRAEDVHHFAWSADPEFIYEGGEASISGPNTGPILVHVLYLPGDDDWSGGTALSRTITALDWFQSMLGAYPWPQLTNLHRIESGGTEFPMLVMNGSASEGLIVHEVAHQFFHGVLANNEFREGWLDEGVASFLTDWYHETQGNPDVWLPSLRGIIQLERSGRTQPISTPGADFADPEIYSAMTYTKAELVLRMLRWMVGEEVMLRALRTLYDRHALSHIDEEDFRAAFAEVYPEDLGWFFDQWLHTTAQLDYSIAEANTRQLPDGSWYTSVAVEREGDAWMPVTLQIAEETGLLTGDGRRQELQVTTQSRPAEVVLDPENVLIDVNPSNNRSPVSGP